MPIKKYAISSNKWETFICSCGYKVTQLTNQNLKIYKKLHIKNCPDTTPEPKQTFNHVVKLKSVKGGQSIDWDWDCNSEPNIETEYIHSQLRF